MKALCTVPGHAVGACAPNISVGSRHRAHGHQRHPRVCEGESKQATCLAVDMLAPAPSPTLSAPTGSDPKGAPLQRTSFRGAGLPGQVSARLPGVITHRGMWAPSLHLTGRHALLPAFPLPRPSAPPGPRSCPTSSPCPPPFLQPSLRPIRTHSPIQTAPLRPEGGGGQLRVKFKQPLRPVDSPWSPTFSFLWVRPADERCKPEAARVSSRSFRIIRTRCTGVHVTEEHSFFSSDA